MIRVHIASEMLCHSAVTKGLILSSVISLHYRHVCSSYDVFLSAELVVVLLLVPGTVCRDDRLYMTFKCCQKLHFYNLCHDYHHRYWLCSFGELELLCTAAGHAFCQTVQFKMYFGSISR